MAERVTRVRMICVMSSCAIAMSSCVCVCHKEAAGGGRGAANTAEKKKHTNDTNVAKQAKLL